MPSTEIEELSSVDELRKKYQRFIDNPGLRRFRNWARPNSAEKTDEKAVNAFMQQDDERQYIDGLKKRFRSLDESE